MLQSELWRADQQACGHRDVDQLKFFYGDPANFFIFQNFTVGVDNIFEQSISH